MKKKKNKMLWLIIALIGIFVLMLYLYLKPNTSNNTNTSSSGTTTKEAVSNIQTITKSIDTSGEVSSGKTKTISLSTSKYFKTAYVEKNDSVKKGENILKYTDGTYLKAPYDCIISEVSLPKTGNICEDTHYVKIESTKILYVTLSVDEADINIVKVGQSAKIKLDANEDKEYTGKIIKISDVGIYSSSGSTFTATVKFTNDGSIKIGMSATCTVILEQAENVVAVPKEAIQTANNSKYVVVVYEDGTTRQNVTVETGISNDAYTEIKSGLQEGETVQYTTTTSNSSSSGRGMFMQSSEGQMPTQIREGGQIPSGGQMPSGSQ